MKLEVTGNDGRVFVKEIRGEEMACVMKCLPVKKCRTKATPEEEIVLHTTPIPSDIDDTTATTEFKLTTMPFQSATSLAKKEQAVSAETTTEMSYSTKEENHKIEDNGEHHLLTSAPTITINRKSATGSIANDRPNSSLTFETIYDVKTVAAPKTKNLDPYFDYSTVTSGSDLDSLNLVTTLVSENQQPLSTTPTAEWKCHDDEICGTEFPISQRRQEKKTIKNLHSALGPSDSLTTVNPLESDTTEAHIADRAFDSEFKNHNLRRHSHEDYDIECDPTEADLTHNVSTEPADIFEDKSHIQPSLTSTEEPFGVSSPQTVTIAESMRRMSESEEIITECDSAEDLPKTSLRPKSSSFIGPSNQLLDEIMTTDRTTITESMRRMTESQDMETECDSVESNGEIDQIGTEQSVTEIISTSPTVRSTQAEEPTTLLNDLLTTPKILATNELSRRMSESDTECSHDIGKLNDLPEGFTLKNDGNSIPMIPGDSMRRMAETNENTSGCDWHEDFIELTTEAPMLSSSMRRMSNLNQPTTELNFEDQTEYVTECDTVVPETSNDVPKITGVKKIVTLECCPDTVCSLLYPNVPICDELRVANYIRKLVELRDMFYLNRAYVLITEIVGETNDDYTRKKMKYERDLVGLWNDTLSIAPNNITNSCTNSSSTKSFKQIISSIHCVLKFTDNLLTDSVLEMVVDAAERIDTDFTGSKDTSYRKFRQIILQSIPQVPNQSDTVTTLANYMHQSRNYDNERILLLQLLIDIQKRFEKRTDKYIISQVNITDASKSLQANGLGIKLHRTSN